MSNELIFFLTTLLDLSFVLLFFRLGRRGLLASVVVNVILVATFGAKLISIFGLVTNVGNVFYSSIFLAVNIMVERFGRKEALKAIWSGFAALFVFMLMGQFVVASQGLENTHVVNEAIATLFGFAPRLTFASMFAYIISQHFNLWFYEQLLKKTKLVLGFRNFISTAVAQFFDSLFFFFFAFYGTISNSLLWESIFTGYLLKIIIAIISIPYIYASLKIKLGTDLSETYQDEQDYLLREKEESEFSWHKLRLAKFLALVVSACGLMVMGGWLFGIDVLTYLIEGYVTMKFSTATSFVCAGVVLYFICENFVGKKDIAAVVLPAATMVIMLFMSTLFVSTVFRVSTGIEGLVVQEVLLAKDHYIAGIPSLVAMIFFTLLSIVSMFTIGNGPRLELRYKILGTILTTGGLSTLIGYFASLPAFYFEWAGMSNGLAIHTGLLFLLLGIGFLLLGTSRQTKSVL